MNISFHTFGCKTNFYDTNSIAKTILNDNNFKLSSNILCADIHVINTCTVTSSSDAQARNLLQKLEKNNKNSLIIVSGCSVRNNDYANYISSFKNNKYYIIDNLKEDIAKIILAYFNINKTKTNNNFIQFRTREFVKIQDGCTNFCSYCIIPYVRTSKYSKSIDKVIEELKILEANNIKEAVITGICIDAYEYGIKNLLESILLNTKDIRIRISSIRPSSIDLNLIALFNEKRIRPHFHISLQSGSDKILKLMNRLDYSVSNFIEISNLIEAKLNKRYPFIGLDVIVGFPGEEEIDFNETYSNLEKAYFTKIHIFKYSSRKKTGAENLYKKYKTYNLKDRFNILNNLSKQRYHDAVKNMVNKKLEILWETNNFAHSENYFELIGEGEQNTIETRLVKAYKGNKLIV